MQKTWLHTLGNLTLTGYNSEYSDRPFIEKRDMEWGASRKARSSSIRGLAQLDDWNEEAIKERAEKLADLAVDVWAAPKLDARCAGSLQARRRRTAGYTIDDHPYLLAGPLREVFEAFRKEVLALDPCVTEEFLKLYVAYKAETNFVDVVPQAKRLRLR